MFSEVLICGMSCLPAKTKHMTLIRINKIQKIHLKHQGKPKNSHLLLILGFFIHVYYEINP